MGIYSRDYLREPSESPGPQFRPGSVCKWLIIANVAIFFLQNMTPAVQDWLQLDPVAVLHGQVWRLVTYSFCHSRGALLHILFNMLFVWWFGKTLESMFGSREFLLFYLTSAFVAGLCFLGLRLVLGQMNPAIGASGAVMAIVMVFALYYPRQQIFLMGIIPMEIRWLVVMYVVFDALPVLQALSRGVSGDGIAHAAHLGGLAFGFFYQRHGLRLERLWDRLRLPRFGRWSRARQRFRIYHPDDHEDFDGEVDRILAKIHSQGESSLTRRERELLKRASRKYRDR